MHRRRPSNCAALVLGLASLLAGPAGAETVLLKNGSVVAGETRREAGVLVVAVSAGGEVRLREADVDFVGPSLVGVYEWLRDRQVGQVSTAEDHVTLAEWCLRNGLWPQAARELLDARSLEPDWRRVELLERRLMLLSEPRSAAQKVSKSESAPTTADSGTPPAEHSSQLTLPDGGLEYFVQRIQPVLLNGCTTTGCHRAEQGGAFPLDRRPLHGYGDARSTTSNLRTALAAIDTRSPAESPLLVAARGPHHNATPIRGPRRQELLVRLEAWAASIAAAQPAVALAPPPSVQAVQAVTYEEPVETEPNDEPQRHEASAASPRIARGGLLQPVEPADEFDPEIFNRRHRRPVDDLPLDAAHE